MRRLILGLILVISATAPLAAQDRTWLGKARMFTNDKLGDGDDRWRSGSYGLSWIRGADWNGTLPTGLGDLVEYRVRSEVIAPANLQNPVIGTDRPYVGILAFGAISHMARGKAEMAIGLDLVATGPMTGIGRFQSFFHRAIGIGTPKVLGSQIGNAVHPTISFELARDYNLGGEQRHVTFRPFLEAQAGVETYLRLGGDLTFGQLGRGDMMVRSPVSGFRTVALKAARARGTSFIMGGDAAYVTSSVYLPTARGYTVVTPRLRLRAGVYSEGKKNSIFYGVTWLGREFTNQPNAQVVGSFTYRLNF